MRRYRAAAFRVAHRLLGHEADALDAVQNAFIKVFTHLDGFAGRSSFKTWLLRVVSNASLDLGRRRGRRESLQRHERAGDAEPAASDDGTDPGRNLDRADLRRMLDDALRQLPDAQRRTFVLHVDGELSYREVADVRAGDLLCVRSAGAYGFSMSSNYNTRPRAAEILVRGKDAHVIRERETVEELLAKERLPEFLA